MLPEGYDGNSVVSEAIKELLAGKGRLALGWTRPRLERELNRLVTQELRRLHRAREAAGTRSEWDVLPLDENEEPQSVFDGIIASVADPHEATARGEEEAARESVRVELDVYLRGDGAARGVFNCLCAGVVKRREIAERLGISVAAVTAARKRLERRLEGFGRKHPGPPWLFMKERKQL